VSAPAASIEWAPTDDAPFRQSAPAPGAESPWLAPVPLEARLPNGVRILLVPRSDLPIVVVQAATRRGADLQAAPGLGAFSGAMLEQGTRTRNALALSDDFESIGAEHGAWCDWDSANVWVKVTSGHLDRAIELLADVVQNPAFAPDEVERVRAQQLATIRQQVDRPAALLDIAIGRTLFARHPFAEPLVGTAEAVARVKPEQLRAFYEARFAPAETTLVVAGDTTRDAVLPKLERAFGAWKRAPHPSAAIRTPPQPKPGVVLVDRPGAPQSNIAVAGVGVERKHPDFDAILVANTVLGGMFSSRLNLNLREKHGYTYGAQSSFDMRHAPGPFHAKAAVDTPNTAASVREMLAEIDRMRREAVTEDELARARGSLVKSLPGRFESSSSTAMSIALLGVFDLPLDEFRTRPARIARIGADDVRRVAEKYFDTSKMRVVVVGDRKAVGPELEKLGVGPVTAPDLAPKPAPEKTKK
jgi:predicted Zn-dependent peptidase